MKVAELFEGTWALPDTVEKANKLAKLMASPLDIRIASKKLYNIFGDDEMFDVLDSELEFIKRDKSTGKVDARDIIKKNLRRVLNGTWENENEEARKILKSFV